MHEFVLYAQVPAERHNTALQVLAGFTRSQPVEVCEQTLIFAQLKVPEVAVSKKLSQKQQQQQTQNVSRPLFQKLQRTLTLNTSEDQPPIPDAWTFRVEQTPDPAVEPTKPGSIKPAHISRDVIERQATPQDLARLPDKEWYAYRYSHTLAGHRFVYGNIVVRVCRFHREAEDVGMSEGLAGFKTFVPTEGNLVDRSGSWVVEAVVRVEDGRDTKIVEAAKRELASFRIAMEGAIDLAAPDRLALDTKVKGL